MSFTRRRFPGIAQGAAVLATAVMLAACIGRTSRSTVSPEDGSTASSSGLVRNGRVVLVTIDGARWQDVFEGSDPTLGSAASIAPKRLMPRTHALVARSGVAIGASAEGCGIARTAGAANMSLPGYQEIFTGRTSPCRDNRCAQVTETVLDEAVKDNVGGVASIGSWEVLAKAVSGGGWGVFVSSGRRWPDQAPSDRLATLVAAGQGADPYPGSGEYRPDHQTAQIALEYMRVARPALFHVGLGDTDEYGHRGDYPRYLAALRYADDVIGRLADMLDAMGAEGRNTTVIVTPDHGRNADFRDHGNVHPESARTFILAFGGGMVARGQGCPVRDVTLADIAPTVRVLMGLPRDEAKEAGRPIELITEHP